MRFRSRVRGKSWWPIHHVLDDVLLGDVQFEFVLSQYWLPSWSSHYNKAKFAPRQEESREGYLTTMYWTIFCWVMFSLNLFWASIDCHHGPPVITKPSFAQWQEASREGYLNIYTPFIPYFYFIELILFIHFILNYFFFFRQRGMA